MCLSKIAICHELHDSIRLKNMHTIKNRQIVQDSIVKCP